VDKIQADSVENLLTSKLDTFFVGINSGLDSLREVRSLYDREIAFDFNPLELFNDCIDENRVSALLAYFLNPNGKHGQKDAFLRILLGRLGSKEALELLDRNAAVKVVCNYTTSNNRFIDIVVTIGSNNFIVGFENKVWGAVDQPEQIRDYVAELKRLSSDHYILLYLSRDGTGPAPSSITEDEIKACDGKFQILAFNNNEDFTILSLLRQWAEICKADPVRSFLKFVEKYLRFYFQGDKTMDESAFLTKYLTKHSDFASQVPALVAAYSAIKSDAQQAVYQMINSQLNESPLKISPSATLATKKVKFIYEGKKLPSSLNVHFEYPDIGLPIVEDQKFSNNIQDNNINKDDLKKFIIAMRSAYSDIKTNVWWLGGFVRLPNYIVDDKLLIDALDEKTQTFSESIVLKKFALNVTDFIIKYIHNVETEWQKAGLPLAK
jgi:hypothetical protein